MFGPLAAERRTPLQTLNPLVTLVLVGIVAATMIATFSFVTATIMIIAELPLIVLARLSPRAWLWRAWPLALALIGIMVANLLFTDIHSGTTLLHAGAIWVTTDGLAAAGSVALRLLVLAIPGIVLFARLDPTELADSLVTHWHARARMAMGSLAALRLAPLVLTDLRQSYAARRTRGLIGRNPLLAVPMAFSTLSMILVTAIRRATRLSAAMDSRGFDSGVPRTMARVSRWRVRDWVVSLGYLAAAMIAVAAGVLLEG
ncbi:energy-coupling factor transporter transmembrane protein EcfT [Microlunatus elymi]|uniref:Energy-coupling factor transporter transmembrane protein EcfT n=1 Tax=Microlunatus elymi TaxID=2596828 RepID=A0A516Q1S1_9ACTN|nr:energy-coupling factor transporter transmembrane component T [Microlunatus elymi]QDP97385.1 energy-coupling factor transporter transmembrane protein EcfT [Microlunatus elymi]